MKTIIILFTIAILYSSLDISHCYAQTTRQWNKYQFGELDINADTKGVSRIVLITETIAYGIGYKTFRTDNGGASWKVVEYPKSLRIYSEAIDYNDGQIMYLTGTMVYISNDSGRMWSEFDYFSSPDSIPLLYNASITLLKKNNAIISGKIDDSTGGIIKTTDGGNTWKTALIPDSTPIIYEVSFVSENTGIACTYSGHILRTTDAGNTWKKVYQQTNRDWWNCEFGPTGIGTVGGTNSALLMTTDSGATWKIIPYILDENGFYLGIGDAYPFDSLNILVGDHKLRRTTDGGMSWSVEDEVFPIDYPQGLVDDIDFVNDYGMVAAGPILLYTTPTSSNVENSLNHNTQMIVIPNPVMNTAIIRFPQPSSITTAQLRMYDVLGQHVWSSTISTTRINNVVFIPCASLPPGKYILEAITHSRRFSVTMDIVH